MATMAVGNVVVAAALVPRLWCRFSATGYMAAGHPRHRLRVRASSSTILESQNKPDPSVDTRIGTGFQSLACPICYNPFSRQNDAGMNSASTAKPSLECATCKKAYLDNEVYLDLTVVSGSQDYAETRPLTTEIFRTPLVSYLYERGWRQNFFWGGFPGPEREFEMAKKYLKSTEGGTIIDASCGSGLFSRLFAKSGLYSLVVALDFSENMLRQCYDFVMQDDGIPKERLVLVRADISRLPFVSSSIDAVHAGAALHCWPSPSAGVAEIARVLRPGGVFVATTFILDGIYALPVFRAPRQLFIQATSNQLYSSEGELEDLCRACGLVDFVCVRNGPFVMLSATKPR